MRHSERGRLNTCPYAYKLEKDGVRRAVESIRAEDRTFGQAIHEGLKAHYDGKDWDGVVKAYESLYPQGREYKSKAKSYESGIETLREYRENWRAQDKMWEVIGTEIEDTVEFGDEEHGLHVDLLARHRQTGELWAWDHKTTEKQLGKGFWKKYELDSQVTRYTEWVIQKYGSCGGFIINGIQVGHRQRAYKGEPAGFYQRFDRQPFSRTKEQIEFWKESEADWERLLKFCQERNVWPKHLGALCGWCDYYDLCMSGASEGVKETLYSNDTFNVVDETK